MADKEIDDLTVAGTLDGTELFYIVQSGNSRKVVLDTAISRVPVVYSFREKLSATRAYYVNATSGSDSNDGLSSGAGAFATLQKAMDTVATLDLGGYDVTVNLADDSYGSVELKQTTGHGTVIFSGNILTPANVTLTSSTSGEGAIHGSYIVGTYEFEGMTLGSTGSAECIRAEGPGLVVTLGEGIVFGDAGKRHMLVFSNATVQITDDYEITGDAEHHALVIQMGFLSAGGTKTLTLTGTPDFSIAFAEVRTNSLVNWTNVTASGSATGKRYEVETNGTIFTNGAGASALPGDSAGSTADGGIYA